MPSSCCLVSPQPEKTHATSGKPWEEKAAVVSPLRCSPCVSSPRRAATSDSTSGLSKWLPLRLMPEAVAGAAWPQKSREGEKGEQNCHSMVKYLAGGAVFVWWKHCTSALKPDDKSAVLHLCFNAYLCCRRSFGEPLRSLSVSPPLPTSTGSEGGDGSQAAQCGEHRSLPGEPAGKWCHCWPCFQKASVGLQEGPLAARSLEGSSSGCSLPPRQHHRGCAAWWQPGMELKTSMHKEKVGCLHFSPSEINLSHSKDRFWPLISLSSLCQVSRFVLLGVHKNVQALTSFPGRTPQTKEEPIAQFYVHCAGPGLCVAQGSPAATLLIRVPMAVQACKYATQQRAATTELI